MTDNSQTRAARRKQKKTKKRPFLKKALLIFGIIVLAIGLGVCVLFTYYIATSPGLDEDKLSDRMSSKVYDQDGELIADLGDIQWKRDEYDCLLYALMDAVRAS